jgi:prevent-host-death family protein
MIQVTIHKAKTNLSALIEKVMGGEEVVIAKGKHPVVKIVPLETFQRQRKIGSAKGRIRIADDFDELLDDFRDYHP